MAYIMFMNESRKSKIWGTISYPEWSHSKGGNERKICDFLFGVCLLLNGSHYSFFTINFWILDSWIIFWETMIMWNCNSYLWMRIKITCSVFKNIDIHIPPTPIETILREWNSGIGILKFPSFNLWIYMKRLRTTTVGKWNVAEYFSYSSFERF